jgi:hypothetical protein
MKKIAFGLLIAMLILVILFHFFIIAKLIPYTIAWGGRLENDSQMYVFEVVSILINSLLITFLLLKNNSINHSFSQKPINIVLWIFMIIFLLNTVGNLFAETTFEKYFALVTFIFALLIGVMLKKEKRELPRIESKSGF